MKCRICQKGESMTTYKVKEMMHGSGELFTYLECQDCGTLQISEFPRDTKKYYPLTYYSFNKNGSSQGRLKSYFKRKRDLNIIKNRGVLGCLLEKIYPDIILSHYTGIPEDYSILDIGCGSGEFLIRLKDLGFNNVMGIDPLINDRIVHENNLVIERKKLEETEGRWDLITYHHSFEHINDPFLEMKLIYEHLSDNGMCIIRIPVADSYAWEHYRSNWVQLDAPRHLFIYSQKSLKMLAESAGLSIIKTSFDSGSFQFWGSEQYIRNIPLNSQKSWAVNKPESIFSFRDIKMFEKQARKLNAENRGDQAAFFLKKMTKISVI
jgi:SAM-dependent methyltransferase